MKEVKEASVLDVARYVIKCVHPVTTMKLQKLVYYCQAWSLAWDEVPLFPEDIKKIRKQYGLSRDDFAKLLNWDDKTVRRYENGAVQTRAQNDLLLFISEPDRMRTYLSGHETALTEKQVAKLLDTVNKLTQENWEATT